MLNIVKCLMFCVPVNSFTSCEGIYWTKNNFYVLYLIVFSLHLFHRMLICTFTFPSTIFTGLLCRITTVRQNIINKWLMQHFMYKHMTSPTLRGFVENCWKLSLTLTAFFIVYASIIGSFRSCVAHNIFSLVEGLN